MPEAATEWTDEFDGDGLDPDVWLPHYLPMWSSRAHTRASYRLTHPGLVLDLPVAHPLWLPDVHSPLRVSGIQSGNRSGPVGSTDGQQEVHPGQVVCEEQPELRGHLQAAGHLEVRCAMRLSHRSMASVWLCGFQERPEDCGELCVVEVFGKSVVPGRSAEVGVGIKSIRDPRLTDDFAAPRLDLDVTTLHTYAVDWDASEAVFSVDGVEVRRCWGPPEYPLQVMAAVFDFPEWSRRDDGDDVPVLIVDGVRAAPALPAQPTNA